MLTGRRELWGGSQATSVRGEMARPGVGATPWNTHAPESMASAFIFFQRK
jgi:hypothetical protein